MKKLLLLITLFCVSAGISAQDFEKFFTDRTLRIDYLFTGDAANQSISVDELSVLPGWAGRRHHLSALPLQGNGQIYMKDIATGDTIYATSFSSLFQEWLETDEAKTVRKGFENSFLLPFPKNPVEINITLMNLSREIEASLSHRIDPKDILIHQKGLTHITPHRYLLKSGSSADCIDVAILAEGYTEKEMETFYKDASIACESLFAHEPFKSHKTAFNIVAVASPSQDSGVSIPRLHDWRHTAFGSHFSTFYSDRYLTSLQVKRIHDALAGIPYEHIIILANTDEYGGGGIYNSYTLTTAHHPSFRPVVVHEFGHSFGGLADEYFYENDTMTDTYPLNVEPWEQNVTTLTHFSTKWQDMLEAGTPVPTPKSDKDKYSVGVYEGGAYSSKGVYRGAWDCRMRTNTCPAFCPVCRRSLERLIKFYTEK